MSDVNRMPDLVSDGRINYPWIIASAILKFFDAVVKVEGEQSEQEVREAALSLFNSIPRSWWDDQFLNDKAKAVIKEKVDARREWCGVKVGKPRYIIEEKIEPYRLYSACVNLLDRQGLLPKILTIKKQLESRKVETE